MCVLVSLWSAFKSSFRTCLYAWYFIHWVWSWRIFIRSNLSCRWRALSFSRLEYVCICVLFSKTKQNRVDSFVIWNGPTVIVILCAPFRSAHDVHCMHWHDEDLSIYAIVARYLPHKRHNNPFLDSNNPICFMRQILSIEYASNYELPACIYSVNSISWLAIDWFELMWKKKQHWTLFSSNIYFDWRTIFGVFFSLQFFLKFLILLFILFIFPPSFGLSSS